MTSSPSRPAPCSSWRTRTGRTRPRSTCSGSSRDGSTTCPLSLVLTYRDELDRDHPLSRLLGDLGHGDRVERIALRHLSAAAVGALTAGSGLDADRVYAMTEGNPYFVSELVASADEARVPPTVVDAVTGRLRRLDAVTQDHVEQLAVVPSAVDHDLLARLVPGSEGALRAAEEGGLLAVSPDGVRFRHELTRHAIVDALPTSRRIELEHRVFVELLGSGVADPARLVHHALEAGDVDAVVEWAPRAARDAAASGAHRQATAHYRAALDHTDRYEPAELADLCGGVRDRVVHHRRGTRRGGRTVRGRRVAAAARRPSTARVEPALALALPVVRRPTRRRRGLCT